MFREQWMQAPWLTGSGRTSNNLLFFHEAEDDVVGIMTDRVSSCLDGQTTLNSSKIRRNQRPRNSAASHSAMTVLTACLG